VTRGQLPQRAGLLGLNGGGTAAAVPANAGAKNSNYARFTLTGYLHLYITRHGRGQAKWSQNDERRYFIQLSHKLRNQSTWKL